MRVGGSYATAGQRVDWDDDERGGLGLRPCTPAPNAYVRRVDNGVDRLDHHGGRSAGRSNHGFGGDHVSSNKSGKVQRGVIVSLRDSEGFGFIKPDTVAGHRATADVFFHLGSGLEHGTHPDELWLGAVVEFIVIDGRETKPRAINVRLTAISDPTASLRPVETGLDRGRGVFPSGVVGAMDVSLRSNLAGSLTCGSFEEDRKHSTTCDSAGSKSRGVAGCNSSETGRKSESGSDCARSGAWGRGKCKSGLRDIQRQQQVSCFAMDSVSCARFLWWFACYVPHES